MVIIGGGFGGILAARSLKRANVDITDSKVLSEDITSSAKQIADAERRTTEKIASSTS